jgi:hypothetical protein
MKKYISGLLQLAASGLLLFTIYKQNEVIKKYKASDKIEVHNADGKEVEFTGENMQGAVDSLNDEIFNLQSINGRYELSLDHLKEVNPKAAKQFEDYMSHETE